MTSDITGFGLALCLAMSSASCHLGNLPAGCRRDALATSTAQEAFRRYDAVVVGLDQYESRVGQYPRRLDDLVPGQLPSLPPPPDGVSPLQYERTPDGYTLSFTFYTTCAHDCVRKAGKGWTCHSYL
jgi:hypothetical protein